MLALALTGHTLFMTRVQHQVVIVTLVTDLVRIPVVLMDLMVVVVLIVSKMLCHETVMRSQTQQAKRFTKSSKYSWKDRLIDP